MRIILVAGINPARTKAGGIRSYVLNLAESLSQMGQEVTVVGAGPRGRSDRDRFEFVSVTDSPEPSSYRFLASLAARSASLPLRASILHAQRADDLAVFALRRDLAARILTFHGNAYSGIRERHGIVSSSVYRGLEWLGIRQANRLIVLERQAESELRTSFPHATGQIVRCPNGVNLGAFSPKSREEARAALGIRSMPTIVFVGRLVPEKNLQLLLDAHALTPTAQLVVAGGGPLEQEVRAWAREHAHVVVLGTVDHARVPTLLNAGDVLALPSHREALPTVCLEALACGTPVVATPVGGLPDLVHDGVNGYIAIPEPGAFAHALSLTMASSNSMRNACRESSLEFGWDRVALRLLEVYREAAS